MCLKWKPLNNMKITIKKVKEEDVSYIFGHYKNWVMTLFPESSDVVRRGFVEKAFNKDFMINQVKGSGIVLSANVNKKLVGLLIARGISGGVSYCPWLMVDPSFQKKGVGKSLLKYWEDEVKKMGGHGLRLDANQKNVKFYKKMGFKLIGYYEKGYFGLDQYYFQKNIAEPREENFFK
jgi:GNAT superfamily N-acetyltransferase